MSCYKYGVAVATFLRCTAFLYFLLCYKLQGCNKVKEVYISVQNGCSNWDLFLLIPLFGNCFWWSNPKTQNLCSFFIYLCIYLFNVYIFIYIRYFNIFIKIQFNLFYVYFLFWVFIIKKRSVLENMSIWSEYLTCFLCWLISSAKKIVINKIMSLSVWWRYISNNFSDFSRTLESHFLKIHSNSGHLLAFRTEVISSN